MSDTHPTTSAVAGKPADEQAPPALHPSTTAPAGRGGKPPKPYPEYPLTAHPAGYWCKKILGKIHYFGPWTDPKGALEEYERQKDALHAGRKPRPDTEAVTVKDVANDFLNTKQA